MNAAPRNGKKARVDMNQKVSNNIHPPQGSAGGSSMNTDFLSGEVDLLFDTDVLEDDTQQLNLHVKSYS